MIYCDVFHQKLQLVNAHAAADTVRYLEMKFCFRTDDWNGTEKWAHFSKEDAVYDVLLTDDRIRAEDGLNLPAGEWTVWLHGNKYDGGGVTERITTETVRLTVEPTGSGTGEPFPEMPVSVTEQLIARLRFLESRIKAGTGEMLPWEVRTQDELNLWIAAGYSSITLAPDADITVSGTLELPAGTILHGNGAVIRRDPAFNGRMFVLSSDCRIENLTIYGERTTVENPGWQDTREISISTGSHRCVVENVTIFDGNDAITASGYDHIVRGCRLYNCGGNGIHIGTVYGMLIDGCTVIGANKNASVMGNSRGCIYVCRIVERADIVNCYCEDGLAGVGGVDGPDDNGIKILGCTVKNCTQAIEGTYISDGGPREVVISGNQFLDCGDLYLSDTDHDYLPGDGLVISGNLFRNTGIQVRGFRRATVTGNTLSGNAASKGMIRMSRCPNCVASDNVAENPAGYGLYFEESTNVSVSGNTVRCGGLAVFAENCPGILIFGNILRQSPHTSGSWCIQLLSSHGAAVDNNKMFLYRGGGVQMGSNSRAMGNIIAAADSSLIVIRVWGGNSGYIVAQNMTNAAFSVATGTDAVVENNITSMTTTAFADVTYTLTNLTTDGFAKALTEDDFFFTLTAADGYALPETITVTMDGTELAAGSGYTYDAAAGTVTVYRVSGAVAVTAEGSTA